MTIKSWHREIDVLDYPKGKSSRLWANPCHPEGKDLRITRIEYMKIDKEMPLEGTCYPEIMACSNSSLHLNKYVTNYSVNLSKNYEPFAAV